MPAPSATTAPSGGGESDEHDEGYDDEGYDDEGYDDEDHDDEDHDDEGRGWRR